jgi:xylose isomerase
MALKAFNVGPATLRSMPFWCVGNPLGDPFGGIVLPRISSVEVAEVLAWAAGEGLIEATSFHDDDLVHYNPEDPEDDLDPRSQTSQTLKEIKEILDGAGLKINTATCSLHVMTMFRDGGLTNPDPKIRAIAKKKVERTLRIGAKFGASWYTYWVARDGFEVPVAVDWKNTYKWLAEGLDHVYDYVKAKKFRNYIGATIEPKPNEPRGQMYLPTSGHAVGFINGMLKHPEFYKVNPELLQHESMALLNAVMTVGFLTAQDKLAFLHFGSQIKAQFDNDFPPLVGPEGLKETVQMFWALKQVGWKGLVEFDCHMLRAEGDPENPDESRKQFIVNCVSGLSIALELAERLDGNWQKGLSYTQADLAGIMRLTGLSAKKITNITLKK